MRVKSFPTIITETFMRANRMPSAMGRWHSASRDWRETQVAAIFQKKWRGGTADNALIGELGIELKVGVTGRVIRRNGRTALPRADSSPGIYDWLCFRTGMSSDSFELNSQNPQDLSCQTLGPYVLMRRLGRGGMAEVYLAEQKTLKRFVAVKVLKPELAKDETFVKRFHHEAQAAAALVQSNIVQIYEVGQQDGIHYIAQEYVRGQNLRHYVNRHGAVEPIVAVNIVRQVAAALQKAAEQGVIHRDIKPENIMLSPNGEVKVADFGLARVTTTAQPNDLTQVGITMGTPLYMSPEQIEGRKVDPRSDLYSLGITAFHMLAGEPPYDGENALAIAVQHLKNKPRAIEEIRPDVPAELCRAIHKMMEKNPDDRYQSPAELLKDLRKIEIDFDQWDALVEKLSADDTATPMVGSSTVVVGQSKYAVTKQLETIMSGHIVPYWRRPGTLLGSAALALVALLVGVAVANRNPPRDLLETDFSITDVVPKKESVEAQYRYAYWHAEKGPIVWEAVSKYFPPQRGTQGYAFDLLYSRRADERLAEIYLQSDDLDKALPIFERFSNVEQSEQRLRIIGRAGKAIVFDRQGKTDRVSELLYEVEDHIDKLGREMRQEVEQLLRKYAGAIENDEAGIP